MAAFSRVKGTAKRVLVPALLLLAAVFFLGAAFPQISVFSVPVLPEFREPVRHVTAQIVTPAEREHSLTRLKALIFAERAISVSA